MPEELEIAGLHAERHGEPDQPLVLCVHGLSANVRSFDTIAGPLAEAGRQVVALDLRGRGATPDSGPGTYGLESHARDVLAVADELGAERFAMVGWSMGAMITLTVAGTAAERLTHAVLVDAAATPEQGMLDAVRAGLARLDAVVPDPQAYLDAIRAVGAVQPWEPFWDAYYRYELVQREDGSWSPRTSARACLEDFEGALDADLRALWPSLTMPSLLVRCTAELNGGVMIPEADRDALRETAADLEVAEIDRNHFGVVTHPAFARAVVDRLTT